MFDMEPVTAQFPVQKFSVITGQSGSGKSTLFFRNLAPRAESGEFKQFGIQALSVLSTGDFHGSRRSTVASAIGLNTLLKDLFAKLPESRNDSSTRRKKMPALHEAVHEPLPLSEAQKLRNHKRNLKRKEQRRRAKAKRRAANQNKEPQD